MLKVPGVPLSELSELPDDIVNKFNSMILDLTDKDIIHGDLKPANILYDADTKRLWPIDMSEAITEESYVKNYNDMLSYFSQRVDAEPKAKRAKINY